jgi:hypothetical protein
MRNILFFLVAFFLLNSQAHADGAPDAAAFTYSAGSYSAFTVPGVFAPAPFGINNLGQIVGTDGNENIGFLYQNGNTTIIAPVGNFSTRPQGINDSGLIVGNEFYPGSQGFRVFIDNAGTITMVAVPQSATAAGLNNAGQIVGSFDSSAGTEEGFVYAKGVFSSFIAPGSTSTFFSGISNSGEIVGNYLNSSGDHIFVYDLATGAFSTVSVPCSGANAAGINSHDEIVGDCRTGGRVTGYEYDYITGQFTPIIFPLSNIQLTAVTGINDNGEVIGFYTAPEPGILSQLTIGFAGLIFVKLFRNSVFKPS